MYLTHDLLKKKTAIVSYKRREIGYLDLIHYNNDSANQTRNINNV